MINLCQSEWASALLGNGSNSTNMAAKIKADEASTAVKYNTFRIKSQNHKNRKNRSRLGKLDRELVAAAALGTRVGKIKCGVCYI